MRPPEPEWCKSTGCDNRVPPNEWELVFIQGEGYVPVCQDCYHNKD